MYRAFNPIARLRSKVSPSATAPAAGLFPSTPSVPALSTAIFFPAILFTQTKSRVSPADPLAPDRRADLPIRNHRDALPWIRPAHVFKLRQQIFGRLFHRPIIGGVVAARYKSLRLRSVMRRMKQIIEPQQK